MKKVLQRLSSRDTALSYDLQHHVSIHLWSYDSACPGCPRPARDLIYSTCHTWVDTTRRREIAYRVYYTKTTHEICAQIVHLTYMYVPQLLLQVQLEQLQLQLEPQLDAQLKLFMHINFHSSAAHWLTAAGCPFEWQTDRHPNRQTEIGVEYKENIIFLTTTGNQQQLSPHTLSRKTDLHERRRSSCRTEAAATVAHATAAASGKWQVSSVFRASCHLPRGSKSFSNVSLPVHVCDNTRGALGPVTRFPGGNWVPK